MEEENAALKEQLAALQLQFDNEKKVAEEAKVASDEAKAELKKVLEEAKKKATSTVFVSQGRRLDVFKDRPSKPEDMSVRDWIVDVRGQLALRQRTPKEEAAFIKDHLGGNARQEILGRGESVSNNPEKILQILERVFGDGDTLPQLQQRYFSYRQHPNEDLLSCSLGLVTLYDRISSMDPTYHGCRESMLKSRLAEAVQDEALQRELRRLNVESPSLSFFELRDRAIDWLGKTNPIQATVKEARAEDNTTTEILQLLQKQQEQLKRQQEQIDGLIKSVSVRKQDRRCFSCNQLHQ